MAGRSGKGRKGAKSAGAARRTAAADCAPEATASPAVLRRSRRHVGESRTDRTHPPANSIDDRLHDEQFQSLFCSSDEDKDAMKEKNKAKKATDQRHGRAPVASRQAPPAAPVEKRAARAAAQESDCAGAGDTGGGIETTLPVTARVTAAPVAPAINSGPADDNGDARSRGGENDVTAAVTRACADECDDGRLAMAERVHPVEPVRSNVGAKKVPSNESPEKLRNDDAAVGTRGADRAPASRHAGGTSTGNDAALQATAGAGVHGSGIAGVSSACGEPAVRGGRAQAAPAPAPLAAPAAVAAAAGVAPVTSSGVCDGTRDGGATFCGATSSAAPPKRDGAPTAVAGTVRTLAAADVCTARGLGGGVGSGHGIGETHQHGRSLSADVISAAKEITLATPGTARVHLSGQPAADDARKEQRLPQRPHLRAPAVDCGTATAPSGAPRSPAAAAPADGASMVADALPPAVEGQRFREDVPSGALWSTTSTLGDSSAIMRLRALGMSALDGKYAEYVPTDRQAMELAVSQMQAAAFLDNERRSPPFEVADFRDGGGDDLPMIEDALGETAATAGDTAAQVASPVLAKRPAQGELPPATPRGSPPRATIGQVDPGPVHPAAEKGSAANEEDPMRRRWRNVLQEWGVDFEPDELSLMLDVLCSTADISPSLFKHFAQGIAVVKPPATQQGLEPWFLKMMLDACASAPGGPVPFAVPFQAHMLTIITAAYSHYHLDLPVSSTSRPRRLRREDDILLAKRSADVLRGSADVAHERERGDQDVEAKAGRGRPTSASRCEADAECDSNSTAAGAAFKKRRSVATYKQDLSWKRHMLMAHTWLTHYKDGKWPTCRMIADHVSQLSGSQVSVGTTRLIMGVWRQGRTDDEDRKCKETVYEELTATALKAGARNDDDVRKWTVKLLGSVLDDEKFLQERPPRALKDKKTQVYTTKSAWVAALQPFINKMDGRPEGSDKDKAKS